MAAGPYIPNYVNAPAQSAVIAFDSSGSNQLMYLGKDDNNVTSGTDTWTKLPPVPDLSPYWLPPEFARIEFGGGIGYVYTMSVDGRLMEYLPSTNQWANRGYPGEKYTYHEYVDALADARGYTGDGDWAPGELKAECAATETAMGISHSAKEGYSLLCAQSDTPPSHTASQYTIALSQEGVGSGVWDPDPNAQDGACYSSDMVVGIPSGIRLPSAAVTASMHYILCAPAGSTRSNCRPRCSETAATGKAGAIRDLGQRQPGGRVRAGERDRRSAATTTPVSFAASSAATSGRCKPRLTGDRKRRASHGLAQFRA